MGPRVQNSGFPFCAKAPRKWGGLLEYQKANSRKLTDFVLLPSLAILSSGDLGRRTWGLELNIQDLGKFRDLSLRA